MHISDHALVRSSAKAALSAVGVRAQLDAEPVALCRGVVSGIGAPLSADELSACLRSGKGLAELGAPYAAVLADESQAVLAADHVGLAHVYATSGPTWAAIGTSARELAGLTGVELDREALAVQRMVGHHLDNDTAYQGVRKLAPGHLWRLSDGVLTEQAYPSVLRPYGDAAAAHAFRLRDLVVGFLEHQPEALLELSGGLDSRMVLAAVPAAGRRRLDAFTIVAAGSTDGQVAAELAARYGMRHFTVDLDGLTELTPQQAYELAHQAASRQDGFGAPLWAAALGWAEQQIAQVPRLSGHGGQIARGAYHLQPPHPSVSPELIDRLAHWIFANHAVDDAALEHDFALESHRIALRRIRTAFGTPDTDWITAADDFFLRQRLHRWAGITVTDACRERLIFNPLLDAQVSALARSVPSRLRTGSRYAAEVLDLLDPDLARVPLDCGLRPVALSRQLSLSRKHGENNVRGFGSRVGGRGGGKAGGRVAGRVGGRGGGTVFRRPGGARRATAGAAALGDLVVMHWQGRPHLLEAVVKTGLVDEQWLDMLIHGVVGTDPATVDFLLNLSVVATPAVTAGV